MSWDAAIAPHLRRYVVQQDYAAYTARDQAVWRFAVRLGHARLRAMAHPAYEAGFRAAGISTERIPELREMSRCLEQSGFRVVCVDGFIPPRAFQAFQARGVLPIAADIRSAAHLTYTPAPDIIHEAAGHAPFLAEPEYAAFLRRIGAVSEQAFESEHDRAVYQAIYQLSELKENPESSGAQVDAAAAELARLSAAGGAVSEATRMARLYWWTVEYGLIGSVTDYRLYGAGLLSSMGEAHFCHDPAVRKLPLSAACVEQDYDITEAQPQLFVARDFAHLHEVLSEVEQTLSHIRGGDAALGEAKASGDVARLVLHGAPDVIGTVSTYDEGHVQLRGRCALAEGESIVHWLPDDCPGYVLPLGALRDGRALNALTREQLPSLTSAGELRLDTRAGVCVRGQLQHADAREGRLRLLVLSDVHITHRGRPLLVHAGPYPLVLASEVQSATPRLPAAYYPPTLQPEVTVPRARQRSAEERELIALHERIMSLAHTPADKRATELESMHAQLVQRFPEEWLLRFNLLESAAPLGREVASLRALLEAELEALELHFRGREPIALALSSLRAKGA